ncbi:hypothetical protein COBT_001252 [Conglomerata obtusa]
MNIAIANNNMFVALVNCSENTFKRKSNGNLSGLLNTDDLDERQTAPKKIRLEKTFAANFQDPSSNADNSETDQIDTYEMIQQKVSYEVDELKQPTTEIESIVLDDIKNPENLYHPHRIQFVPTKQNLHNKHNTKPIVNNNSPLACLQAYLNGKTFENIDFDVNERSSHKSANNTSPSFQNSIEFGQVPSYERNSTKPSSICYTNSVNQMPSTDIFCKKNINIPKQVPILDAEIKTQFFNAMQGLDTSLGPIDLSINNAQTIETNVSQKNYLSITHINQANRSNIINSANKEKLKIKDLSEKNICENKKTMDNDDTIDSLSDVRIDNVFDDNYKGYQNRLEADINPNILSLTFNHQLNVYETRSISSNNTFKKLLELQKQIILSNRNDNSNFDKYSRINVHDLHYKTIEKTKRILTTYTKELYNEKLSQLVIPDRIKNTNHYFSIFTYVTSLAKNSIKNMSLHQMIINMSRSFVFDKDDFYWLNSSSFTNFIIEDHTEFVSKYTNKEVFNCCEILNEFLPKKLVKIIEAYFSTNIFKGFVTLHMNLEGLLNIFLTLEPDGIYFKDNFDVKVKNIITQILNTKLTNVSILFPQLDLFTIYLAKIKKFDLLFVNDKERFVYICFLQIFSIITNQKWHLLLIEIFKDAEEIEKTIKSKDGSQEFKKLKDDLNYKARIFFAIKLSYEDILAFVLCPILEKECFQRYINMIMLQKLDYLKKFERPFCQKIKENYKPKFGFITKINKLFFAVEIYRNFYKAQIEREGSMFDKQKSLNINTSNEKIQYLYWKNQQSLDVLKMFEFINIDKLFRYIIFRNFYINDSRVHSMLILFCYYIRTSVLYGNYHLHNKINLSKFMNKKGKDLYTMIDLDTLQIQKNLTLDDQIEYCYLGLNLMDQFSIYESTA